MKTWLYRWFPALVWMAFIFFLSHQPGSRVSTALPFFQKLFPAMNSFNNGHFVLYFILALTIYWGLGPQRQNLRGKLLTVAACLLYGISDEVHQYFIEGRASEVSDVRNDTIGAALAMLVLSIPPFARVFRRLSGGRSRNC